MRSYKRGLEDSIPTAVGYLSVSITFGLTAAKLGFTWWQAALVLMLALTSAGQLAAIKIMPIPGNYFDMFIS